MEQRTLRLGDIVDDYCPRERRITNHAIVVMTGADIHSTRCTACESEHPYKHAKLPLRKSKEVHLEQKVHLNQRVHSDQGVHMNQSVHLNQSVQERVASVSNEPSASSDPSVSSEPSGSVEPSVSNEPSGSSEPSVSNEPSGSSEPSASVGWNRPLIRAALPKGIVPAAPRPLPDFTMRSIRNRDGRDGRSNGRRFPR
jgi:hypothetical protein